MNTTALRKLNYQGILCVDINALMLLGNSKKLTVAANRKLSNGCSLGPRNLIRCLSSRPKNEEDVPESNSSAAYDIVIAGGGLVGTALAGLLGKEALLQEHKILVLEAAPKTKLLEKAPERYSNRVSAITPGTKGLLAEIGAWEEIKALRCKGFSKMHVWDACGAGYITFNANGIQPTDENDIDNSMAYIIENSVILSAMSRQIQDVQQNVDVHYDSRIKDIVFPNDKNENGLQQPVSITLEDGRKFETKLLVGADGINSCVRKQAKMRYLAHAYQQTAVVATLHLEKEMQ